MPLHVRPAAAWLSKRGRLDAEPAAMQLARHAFVASTTIYAACHDDDVSRSRRARRQHAMMLTAVTAIRNGLSPSSAVNKEIACRRQPMVFQSSKNMNNAGRHEEVMPVPHAAHGRVAGGRRMSGMSACRHGVSRNRWRSFRHA